MILTLRNNSITYLIGGETISSRPLLPYDPLLCEFLNDLSQELRSNKKASSYPDVVTFAFWCRKANIDKLKADFGNVKTRLGLGMVFHITPSNVPINFAFSFVFGLLSGNANIVRVPSKHFEQIDIICDAFAQLFKQDKYKRIKEMTAFVRYEQNDEITAGFSASCNARIIWGGDTTIRNIRKIPIPERSIEIVFSDRYSFCVIDAPLVIKLNDAQLNRLAEDFYNDTYLMDQNACSSPHLVIWQGKEKQKAKEKFWTAVSNIASKKYRLLDVNAVDKYTLFCQNAIELNNVSDFRKHGNNVFRLSLSSLPDDMDSLRGKFGYFYEYDTDDINSIAHIVNTKFQTLTYFGIDKSKLKKFVVENRLLGIDRIVPIGKALDIDVIWDGYDIIRTLSRIVDVR